MKKRVIEHLFLVLESALAGLLFLILATITLLVVLRYLFGATIIGANEAAVIAFVYITAIGSAIVVSRDEHIAVRYFADKLPAQYWQVLQYLKWILMAAINIAVAAYSIEWIAVTGGFMMPALQLPQGIAQLCIPTGFSLAAMHCLIQILRLISGSGAGSGDQLSESD